MRRSSCSLSDRDHSRPFPLRVQGSSGPPCAHGRNRLSASSGATTRLDRQCERNQTFVGRDAVLEQNHVAGHVERLPAAGTAPAYDFAVQDQAFQIAQLTIDSKGTAGDWHGIVQWIVKNYSRPPAEVVGTDGHANESALSGRGGRFHACERVGNLRLGRSRRCKDSKCGGDFHGHVHSVQPNHGISPPFLAPGVPFWRFELAALYTTCGSVS